MTSAGYSVILMASMGFFDDLVNIIDGKDGDPLSKLADGIEKTLVNGLDKAEEGLQKLETVLTDVDDKAQATLQKVDQVSEKTATTIDSVTEKLG